MDPETARLLAEARKPYADKIMALEAELADTREALRHTEAQLETARAERDSFQDRLVRATRTLRQVKELTLPH